MPTVLIFRGLRVVIYTNDHRPPHVHVMGPGSHARFELLCDQGQVQLMSCFGFSLAMVRLIQAFLVQHIDTLCQVWGEIHDR